MKRILIILLGLFSVAYGQFSPTSAKTRFVNGLYIGTKLDSYFNIADSNAIYWRPDSSVMAKYKGTARKLAFDSSANNRFATTTQLTDTSFRINRPNGTFDTVTISAEFAPNNSVRFLLRATYALMIADGTPAYATIYTVTNDENKSYTRSTYLWKPDGKREWIASTPDN